MIISVNGHITDEKHAMIPVVSKAFLFGFAVFETIRTYNKKVFRLNDYLARLYVSAEMMDFKPKWGFKKTYAEVVRVLKESKWPEAKIRVILTQHNLIVTIEKMKEKAKEMYEKGVKLVSYPGKRTIPRVKKLMDPFCYLAKRHAEECGAYEALLIDPKMYIRECAYANIFWVDGGKLYTTNKDIVFGITRETVVELAGKLDIKCDFDGIKYKSLLNADEIFITQTTSGILPVVEIDGRKIGAGHVGSVTKRLMKAFEELVWQK